MTEMLRTAILAGVLGTVAMDAGNRILARAGLLSSVDIRMIGRMAAGWTRGRFRYAGPEEMAPVAGEALLGGVAHYLIGVGLALVFVFGWDLLAGGPASPAWALAYGVGTTAASLFFVYPCMGLGALGRRSPEGLRAALSPLANHFFFGLGMAVAIALG